MCDLLWLCQWHTDIAELPVKLQQTQARTAIEALQAHPSAWEKVDTILQRSKSEQSKFVALQVRLVCHWHLSPARPYSRGT